MLRRRRPWSSALTSRRATVTIAVAAALACCGAAPAADAQPAAAVRVLSNESTFTHWAHPRERASIRSAPSASAGVVGSLHMLTEEGFPEVYLLLDQATDASGQSWVRLRIPGRPNGRTGWVLRADLGGFHGTDMALRVNISLLRATLFRDGHSIWSAPVGVGKSSTPTPTGRFWVRELLSVPGETLYGPYAFGTSDYSVLTEWPAGGVVGIHGTNEPELIPGRPSHGCIRMRNADITYLAHHLPIGAPVHIVG